ncbi:class I SAM-dependent methyltransferase [Nonomuraea sp. NPDC059023]|uniref:class I SAM-dependent methyltransferase n=1 Tax=unclassified Nonomuraea TaxID=2593643 RepID=UPI0036747D5F
MAGLTGRVLEFGAGDGVKLTCYPPDLDEIIVVEPDGFLRSTAQQVADTLPTPIRIVEGDPAQVPLPDGSCDAVICSLVLCCAPLRATLAEVRRVLRPGGELRFYEHVRSARRPLALTETLITPLWSRACGGCHPARDPVAAIRAAGFGIGRLDRFTFSRFSHVFGIARPG